MVRIAFVIPNLDFGGAQTMLIRLIDGLDLDRFEIKVFIRDSSSDNSLEKKLKNQGIDMVFLDINDTGNVKNKLTFKAHALYRFCNEMNKYDPDIVHSHLELFYSYIYCILLRKKLIQTIHSFPDRIVNTKIMLFTHILLKRSDIFYVGCADCVTRRINEILLKKDRFIRTIYNPINIRDYAETRLKNHEKFTYIHVARMNKIKNQRLLLEAFCIVCNNFQDSQLIMVGDGELYDDLMLYCVENKIDENVCFLGNRFDIPELLGRADVFVLSSNSECCPMTILEAMSSGLPVISTDVGGIGELIKDSGILVKKGNAFQLAEAMIRLRTNKVERVNMSKLALEYVKEFDADKITKEYMKLYQEFLRN